MRILAILAALAAGAWAGTAPKAKGPRPNYQMVSGTLVLPGPTFQAYEVAALTNIKWFACTTEETTAPCTVVAGTFISKIPTSDISVEVEITLFNLSEGSQRIWQAGTFKTTINRPVKGIPVHFTILGPACCKTVSNMKPVFDNGPLVNGYWASFKLGPPAPVGEPLKQ